MKILGIFAIIFGIIAIFLFDFSLDISARINTWTLSYYFWWLSASVFAYLFAYSRIMNKDKLIGYGVLIIYVILGILFLKRSVLFNAIFLSPV